MSIDPIASNFAFSSPYSYCMDRVIDGVDLDGLEYTPYTHVDYPKVNSAASAVQWFDAFFYNSTVGALYNTSSYLINSTTNTTVYIKNYGVKDYVHGTASNIANTGKAIVTTPITGNDIKDALTNPTNYEGAFLTLLIGIKIPALAPEGGAASEIGTSATLNSFEDIAANPKALWGKSADDIQKILGDGWKKEPLRQGDGFKFTKDDEMVSYSEGSTRHGSTPYYKVSSGKTGILKVVGKGYKATMGEKAKIIHVPEKNVPKI